MKISKLSYLEELGGVLCHGCFDMLHAGHVRLFTEAAKLGLLTVTITADRFLTHRVSGQPVYPQELRAEMISALACVQHVAIVDDATALPAISTIHPRVYCKGAEERREGNDTLHAEMVAVRRFGGRIIFIEKELPYSTSRLLSGEFLGHTQPIPYQSYVIGTATV